MFLRKVKPVPGRWRSSRRIGSVRPKKSAIGHLARLEPDATQAFILAQLDSAGLGHNTFAPDALALIVRSAEGLPRNKMHGTVDQAAVGPVIFSREVCISGYECVSVVYLFTSFIQCKPVPTSARL